jgi:flagellar basal-body rod protein FlgB
MAGKVDGGLQMKQTAARHLQGAPAAQFENELKYRAEYQGAVDGNTVNMDVERASFAENAMQFETMITVIRSRFGDMRAAMQSQ